VSDGDAVIARDYAEPLKSLSEGVAALTASERWTQYFEVAESLSALQPEQRLLILAQKPDVFGSFSTALPICRLAWAYPASA